MRPHAYDLLLPDERKIFEEVLKSVLFLPDEIELGEDENKKPIILSCHILARAVSKVFSLKLEDGYFCYHWEHSWVRTPKLNVIDVYPVAILGGPILVMGDWGSSNKMLYQPLPTEAVYGDRFTKPSFLKAVLVVEKFLRKNL